MSRFKKFPAKKPVTVTPAPQSNKNKPAPPSTKEVPKLPDNPEEEIPLEVAVKKLQEKEGNKQVTVKAGIAKKGLDTQALQAKAQAAAVTETYDEEQSYTGIVARVADKGGKSIFFIDGPHGQVQAYSNAISKPTLKQMSTGATVSFTPVQNDGPHGNFFTGVDITVLEQNMGFAILNKMKENFSEEVKLFSSEDILAAMPLKIESYDQALTALSGELGDFIGYDPGEDRFVCVG
jgi:hypothetical protein